MTEPTSDAASAPPGNDHDHETLSGARLPGLAPAQTVPAQTVPAQTHTTRTAPCQGVPPRADPSPAIPPLAAPPGPPRRRPLASRLIIGAVALLLAAATAWHLAAVFLTVAPSTPVARQYQSRINAEVYPEFEQNWQLFAPNPLQENLAVQARVQNLAPDGTRTASGWIDLTAQDIVRLRDNPFPSHEDQNLLRRAWDFYAGWHTAPTEAPVGDHGQLSGEYLKRIALQRIGRTWHGLPIAQIELRCSATPLSGPSWTGAAQQSQTSYRTLPWWPVADSDYQGLLG